MFAMKVFFVLGFTLAVVSAQYGAPTPLTGDDLKGAEGVLTKSLATLASGDGPSYQLGRVISATSQVVSGTKYVYEVELVEGTKTKTCTVDIWAQPWLPENGYQVTFNCPDGKVVKTHN